jgi:hypothetical protein
VFPRTSPLLILVAKQPRPAPTRPIPSEINREREVPSTISSTTTISLAYDLDIVTIQSSANIQSHLVSCQQYDHNSPLTMSVKFEKDTLRQSGAGVPGTPSLRETIREGAETMHDGKHRLLHNAGVVVTGGKEMEGTKGYLAVCDPARLGGCCANG